MLYRAGKPQQVIFYIAHLDDTQRMFFTTLLLEEVLSWTRKQQGTTNLRALLYFDEVYGYLPPHPANPPLNTLGYRSTACTVPRPPCDPPVWYT